MKAKRYHIIIDVTGVKKEILENEKGLEGFLKKLPGLIDMHILSGPVVIKGIDENPGITGFEIIDYSHISIHTFAKYDEALVDVFSCKPYDQEVVTKVALDYFNVSSSNARIQVVSWI